MELESRVGHFYYKVERSFLDRGSKGDQSEKTYIILYKVNNVVSRRDYEMSSCFDVDKWFALYKGSGYNGILHYTP